MTRLPENERGELIARLLESLDPDGRAEIESVWAEEAERRVDMIESGEVESLPGEEALRLLLAGRRP